MPFDLSTAKPVQKSGFDLSTAKPVGRNVTEADRPRLQATVDAYNASNGGVKGAARDFALGPGAEALRAFGRIGKNIAQGGLGLPALALDTPAMLYNAGASALGADSRIPTPFTTAVGSLGGEQLAPRNMGERFQDRAIQGATGALMGVGAGGSLAGSASPVASRVGLQMAQQPVSQAVAGATGGLSAQAAQEAGAGPLGQLAAGMLGGMAGTIATSRVPQQLPIDPNDMSVQARVALARDAGYRLPPREAGGKVGAVAEGASNSAKLERVLSQKNQARTNQLVREELGIGGKGAIPPAALDSLQKKYSSVYGQISKTGKITADEQFAKDMFSVGNRSAQLTADFPEAASAAVEKLRNSYLSPEFDASSAVQAVRQLRADASKYLKTYDDPEKFALGMASRQIADALDNQLQRHVESIGKAGLANAYRSARVQLAKIHTVQDALNDTTGNIQAPVLAKMLANDAPLSGRLLKIAQVTRAFPKAMQKIEGMPNAGIEALDPVIGTVGAGAVGLATQNPYAAALAVPLALARPAARQFLASNAYQNTLGPSGNQFTNQLLQAGAFGAASSPLILKKKANE